MINYPELKFSTNFECVGDYRVTASIRDKLKLVVHVPESLFDEFESLDCGFLLLPKDIELNSTLDIQPPTLRHPNDGTTGGETNEIHAVCC